MCSRASVRSPLSRPLLGVWLRAPPSVSPALSPPTGLWPPLLRPLWRVLSSLQQEMSLGLPSQPVQGKHYKDFIQAPIVSINTMCRQGAERSAPSARRSVAGAARTGSALRSVTRSAAERSVRRRRVRRRYSSVGARSRGSSWRGGGTMRRLAFSAAPSAVLLSLIHSDSEN